MELTRHRILHARDLFVELLAREMKLRYERSRLGMIWAVLNPLTQIAIFTFVFDSMIRLQIPRYPLFVFTGLLAWNWFREGLMASVGAITNNRELVRQAGFPIGVLPIVAITVPLIDLLAALPALFIFQLASGGRPTLAILALPALLALQFLFLLGIGFVLASVHVTFRDVHHLLGVGLMMLFYLTPVFYTPDMVPESARAIYALSPITHLISFYRQILIDGVAPDVWGLLVMALVGALLLPIGWFAFARARHAFVEEL